MPKFHYSARNRAGKQISGELVGNSQNDVLLLLQQQNLIPIKITAVITKKNSGSLYESINEKFLALQSGVKLKDVVFFTRQMATFLDAGVPITKSIKNIADSQKSPIFKRVLMELYEDINSGTDFSTALTKSPKAFNNMYVNIVKAGESTGKMDEALASLATYMEKTENMRKEISSAMMYPKFVLGFTVLIVFGIMWKIMPIFQGLYGGMGAELPAPTQLLIDGSNFLQNHMLLFFVIIIGLYVSVKMAFKLKSVRNLWDKFIINVPTFGILVQQIIVSRVASTLALLLGSGTAVIQALEIGGKVANNNEYETAMEKVIDQVQNGIPMSAAMRSTNRWPDVMVQMVETGEETGKNDELMKKTADYFDEEVAIKVKGFASLIEPLLIVIMGVVIGGIVIAIYLPIFTMGQHLG